MVVCLSRSTAQNDPLPASAAIRSPSASEPVAGGALNAIVLGSANTVGTNREKRNAHIGRRDACCATTAKGSPLSAMGATFA